VKVEFIELLNDIILKKKNINKQKLADNTGISYSYIIDITNRGYIPSPEKFLALLEGLHVNFDEFVVLVDSYVAIVPNKKQWLFELVKERMLEYYERYMYEPLAMASVESISRYGLGCPFCAGQWETIELPDVVYCMYCGKKMKTR